MGQFFSWLGGIWQKLFRPKTPTIRRHLVNFFGQSFHNLQSHDKTFPGYDIASLNHALASFHQ